MKRIANANVLLVEDNEINQMVVTELLEQAGAIVSVAGNGRECLEKVETGTFQAILMDIQMPEMDGYEATRALRDKGLDLPVIAMTAHAKGDERERCLAAGMNDHIAKPVDPDRLYEKLASLISGQEREPDSPVPGKTGQVEPAAGLPERIDGIDFESGLMRVGRNESLYIELLISFRKKYAGFGKDLRHLLLNRDRDTAAKRVHSLKGLAGNLGAKQLFLAADDLEVGIQARGPNTTASGQAVDALAGELERQLDRVIAGIGCLGEPAEPAPQQGGDPVELDIRAVLPLLEELGTFLKSDVVAAIETVQTLETYFTGTHAADLFFALKGHILAFDVEEAIQRLSDLTGRISPP